MYAAAWPNLVFCFMKVKIARLRRLEPLIGEWSLIENFVRMLEDLAEVAKCVLKGNYRVGNVFMKQLKNYGKADSKRVLGISPSSNIL